MKRNWSQIINSVRNFSEEGVKEQSVRRFSEKGEVENYGRLNNVRGDILAKKFLRKKNSQILDVGSASGSVAFTLAKYGYKIDGIDISRDMIDKANKIKKLNKIKNVDFFNSDLISFKTGKKYDYVLGLYNLLTYFPNEEERLEALRKMIGFLKKDGILIMDVTNKFASPRIMAKELFFKILFVLSGKNRKFGDVYSNPIFNDSSEILYQHYFSMKELKNLLSDIKGIDYNMEYYNLFYDKKSKSDIFVVVRKI